jgi:L-ascorbate metabolism protein UlaG (beta-lactamase superfamily)
MEKILATLIVFIALLSITTVLAQRSTPDVIDTQKGALVIQPILHGTLVFTWDNKTIYIDPYGGGVAFEGITPADMVVITDIHADHLNLETLQALQTDGAVFIVPQAVADKLPEQYKRKLVVLKNGETTTQLGISITATPMYNLPETEDSRHPKGRGNGYVLNFAGKNIYISGDTEDIPEMRALTNIDVAFVCMNGPTMDIQQAASAVLAFKPKIVYPFHHRGSDIEAFKKLVNEGNPAIDVRLRNWYPNN